MGGVKLTPRIEIRIYKIAEKENKSYAQVVRELIQEALDKRKIGR